MGFPASGRSGILFKLIQTGYFSEALIFYAVSLEPSKLVLCFCSQIKDGQVFQSEILKGLEKLSRSLMQYYDITAYASLGRCYHTLNGLKSSYEDALMIWKEALNPEKRIRISEKTRKNRSRMEKMSPGRLSIQKAVFAELL